MGADVPNSEIILTNIRVLAIDQAPKEKEGASALVGRTVTLELKPEQTETLARARQSGTLSLALRSIADIKTVEKPEEPTNKRGENLNVIRYGVASQQMMQK
jgi:pilus assembly protein CpaB